MNFSNQSSEMANLTLSAIWDLPTLIILLGVSHANLVQTPYPNHGEQTNL